MMTNAISSRRVSRSQPSWKSLTRVRLDVDKVVVTCRQSEASAEALACEEREHEFQKEAQLACACLRNVECQAAESEQRLTENSLASYL